MRYIKLSQLSPTCKKPENISIVKSIIYRMCCNVTVFINEINTCVVVEYVPFPLAVCIVEGSN